MITLSNLSNLTGNMHRCCQHAANGRSKVKPTRRAVVAAVREEHKKENALAWIRGYRLREFGDGARSNARHYMRRTAVVKRKKGGFHVVGLGLLQGLTFGELKTKLGTNGFTDYRLNGSKRTNLFTGRKTKRATN